MKKIIFLIALIACSISSIAQKSNCEAPKQVFITTFTVDGIAGVQFKTKNDSPNGYHFVITGGNLSTPINLDVYRNSDDTNFILGIKRGFGLTVGQTYNYTGWAICECGTYNCLSSSSTQGSFKIK